MNKLLRVTKRTFLNTKNGASVETNSLNFVFRDGTKPLRIRELSIDAGDGSSVVAMKLRHLAQELDEL